MCNNIFFEDDGFCTACGTYHTAAPKRKSTPTYKDTQSRVQAVAVEPQIENEPTDSWQYMVWATRKIAKHYGFTVDIRKGRGWKTYCRHSLERNHPDAMRPLLNYGIKTVEALDNDPSFKYEEYPTVRPVVNYKRFSGRAALRQVVLHEMAHALVYERGEYVQGISHGDAFKNTYRELMNAGII